MISAVEKWDEAETLEKMSPEARQALARSQDIMDHAALLRASGWMHEDAVRECESRMRGREMDHASNWARSGQWKEKGEYRLNRKVSGGKAGIVGLGRIGREIADRLAAFKMDIHYFARSEKETPGWTYHADPVSLRRNRDSP